MVPDFGPFGDRHHYVLERGEAVIPRSVAQQVISGHAALMAPAARQLGAAANLPDVSRATAIVGGQLLAAPLARPGHADEGAYVSRDPLAARTERPYRTAASAAALRFPAALVATREIHLEREKIIEKGGVSAKLDVNFNIQTLEARSFGSFLRQPENFRELKLSVQRALGNG